MANVHMKNWRDDRGTDFEKAQRVITDRNVNLVETSELLDIPLPTLKQYRHNPEKLKTAGWERVAKLAHLDDANYIKSHMNQQQIKDFLNRLNAFFDEQQAEFSDDDQTAMMIHCMKRIIITDPLAVVELYRAFNS